MLAEAALCTKKQFCVASLHGGARFLSKWLWWLAAWATSIRKFADDIGQCLGFQLMTNSQLLKTALEETRPLTDSESDKYKKWPSPLNQFLLEPAGGGKLWLMTQTAWDCIAKIVDNMRNNNPNWSRILNKDEMLQAAKGVFGNLLSELNKIEDDRERWLRYRGNLENEFEAMCIPQTIYIPVWLPEFKIGPVTIVNYQNWFDQVAGTLHEEELQHVKAFVQEGQKFARVSITGFGKKEAHRRALLATRIALNAIRLLFPSAKISTAFDHEAPPKVVRLAQREGENLSIVVESNYREPPTNGDAQFIIDMRKDDSFLHAAGNCIRVIISANPEGEPLTLRHLSQLWCNAVRWYGRASIADEDLVAVSMYCFALDTLTGGGQAHAIKKFDQLLVKESDIPLERREQAIDEIYEARSKIVHGSESAIDLELESMPWNAKNIAEEMLCNYVIKLEEYRQSVLSGTAQEDVDKADNVDCFLSWLEIQNTKPSKPAF